MTLCDTYQEFLEEQTHVNSITHKSLKDILTQFPDPDNLTPSWFKKRIKTRSPYSMKLELGLACRVLDFLGRDTTALKQVKTPKLGDTVTVEDLYTKEELGAIFKACHHTRDRALFEVLYESAIRAGELLSMRIENIAFDEDGTAMITIKGKTGTRNVPIFKSVPALLSWLNVHPVGKGPVWCSIRSPHKPIKYTALYGLTQKILQRANLSRDKRKIVHMFRHTRITELVTLGVRGQTLHKLAGWTKRSKMEAVYVHLSTHDVTNEVKEKVFGLDMKDRKPEPKLTAIECPRCNTQNDQEARFCAKCNMPLSNDAIVETVQQKTVQQIEIEEMKRELAEIKALLAKRELSKE